MISTGVTSLPQTCTSEGRSVLGCAFLSFLRDSFLFARHSARNYEGRDDIEQDALRDWDNKSAGERGKMYSWYLKGFENE